MDEHRAPDARSAEIEVPIFRGGELEQLKQLHNEFALASERFAEMLLNCHRLVKDAAMVAERIQRRHEPPVVNPAPREFGKPTIHSAGVLNVLRALSELRGEGDFSIPRAALAAHLECADSTLRTYLPVLSSAGYAHLENGCVALTNAGREFLRTLPTPEEPASKTTPTI